MSRLNKGKDCSFEHIEDRGKPVSGVSLRACLPGDAAALAEIYRPYVENTVISFETDAPTVVEFRARIESVIQRLPWIVCELDGRPVGYAYSSQHRERAAYRWSADVAVYIDQRYHRRGLGRQLYTRLIAELKELGYYNAFAGVTLPNANSVGLHESLGFHRIGVFPSVGYKFARWHDVGWWQLQLRDYDPSPREPRTIGKTGI